MKESYPSYREKGTADIEAALNPNDKAILDKFCQFLGITASQERIIKKLKPTMLQYRDIIQKDFNAWTKEDIQGLTKLINQSEKTEWTKNDLKKILRRFIKWMYGDDNKEMYSFIKCKSDLNAINERRVNENTMVSSEEFERLLRAANTLKQKCMLSILFETGCRPQELLSLKWSDINLDTHTVMLYSGKTKKSRTVPVENSIIHIKRYKQNYEYPDVNPSDIVFPNSKDRHKRLTGNALPTMFKRLSKKAGLNRNIFPYLFRHTRLTKLYQDLPEQIVEKYAGHSPGSKMPAVYSHISNDKMMTEILEKVYKVQPINPKRKHELEVRIEKIESILKKIPLDNLSDELKTEIRAVVSEEIQKFFLRFLRNKSI